MCGIFGISYQGHENSKELNTVFEFLFHASESRGKEAAGVAVDFKDALQTFRAPFSASQLLRHSAYRGLIQKSLHSDHSSEPVTVVGHSRLVTNGDHSDNRNNQPVTRDGMTLIHNGIITNVDPLWDELGEPGRSLEVDTEVIPALVRRGSQSDLSFFEGIHSAYQRIEGDASIALIHHDLKGLLLATNTGSLHYCSSAKSGFLAFASESIILERLIATRAGTRFLADNPSVHQIAAGTAVHVDWGGAGVTSFPLTNPPSSPLRQRKATFSDVTPEFPDQKRPKTLSEGELSLKEEEYLATHRVTPNLYEPSVLKRCTRCILPATMPNLTFDSEGVCHFCNAHVPFQTQGREALESELEKHRKKGRSPDCVIAVSGGRDSCYGLHYLKKELGINPIAYTYDWGMVTDLARRNTARMLGKLGIEHILVSADIRRKRENVRKNLSAWLKRPTLGMIPILMAGDKQFYYYANKVRQENHTDLVVYCSGNNLEKTDFKTGFCGINEGVTDGKLKLPFSSKLQLIAYYGANYLLNPRYINQSLFDTVFAYYSAYMQPHDALFLYNYLPWDENEIMDTLTNEYHWESAPDTAATWRIGDGTASFYNYVYYSVAGITENDTFRSNQIREGMISRETALKKAEAENQPRYRAIKAYLDLLGLDFVDTMKRVDAMPRLYENTIKEGQGRLVTSPLGRA